MNEKTYFVTRTLTETFFGSLNLLVKTITDILLTQLYVLDLNDKTGIHVSSTAFLAVSPVLFQDNSRLFP